MLASTAAQLADIGKDMAGAIFKDLVGVAQAFFKLGQDVVGAAIGAGGGKGGGAAPDSGFPFS